MFKFFFPRSGRTLLLATAAAVFASSAWAQRELDTARYATVPFLVNVDATIEATRDPLPAVLMSCNPALLPSPRQITVTADNEAFIILDAHGSCTGVLNGAQRQANVPAIVSGRGGRVTVNLSAQSYKDAEISLYTVNGKRILRDKASASSAVNRISRPNAVAGIYLLSVRGADGGAVTSRLTHGGGELSIDAVFGSGSETLSVGSQMAKKAFST